MRPNTIPQTAPPRASDVSYGGLRAFGVRQVSHSPYVNFGPAFPAPLPGRNASGTGILGNQAFPCSYRPAFDLVLPIVIRLRCGELLPGESDRPDMRSKKKVRASSPGPDKAADAQGARSGQIGIDSIETGMQLLLAF